MRTNYNPHPLAASRSKMGGQGFKTRSVWARSVSDERVAQSPWTHFFERALYSLRSSPFGAS